MTSKELRCIYSSISNAQEIIEQLASEDYPYSGFVDDDFREMFYELNTMCLTLNKKLMLQKRRDKK